ncbi:alpha/beta hydrolase [Treponema phagedenis]|uniref:alpha/beta hydrolase n=1 Tax=Treponema phagedenis TaxID=162 RepID=UPI0001F639F0|nr:alpha/beta hydrolase [Treponema phagedenis]EFW39254.1 hypothetical protein HMPREF9554_00241 [Treponema phagedenis F0421]TYT78108.1 alpha/beta hydrolase [Treponema phagedenis]
MAKKAILFIYGGGMIIGPDRGDVRFAVELAQACDSDVWFPYYPLCIEHTIDESYKMVFQCYREMTELYNANEISLFGFSSGAALALGIGFHNNALGRILPMPRQIIAVSPGSVPASDEEIKKMEALNERDFMVDAKFMSTVKSIMSKGKNIPEYMLSGTRGDFSGLPPIHFYYGGDEVLSACAKSFASACDKKNVPYTMTIAAGMCHCYAIVNFFLEGKAGRAEITERLK